MTSPPVVVGRYRLDELFRPEVDASTWKATDLTARRAVLACLCAGETGAAARSRRTTVHPGLVPVLDVVRVRDGVEPRLENPDKRGEIFVIQEAPEGAPLDSVRQLRAFEAPEAVRVALAVANALTAVHAKGSVHGGVCPAAIEHRAMEDGGPRLGLRGIGDPSLAYASPGRLCDGGPSVHDDAWGLLGVLYFLLTGSPPFSAETPQALARRVLGGRPIPIKMAGPSDAELQKIFDRGFSRTASQRFPDVSAVRDDLRGWLSRFGTANLGAETEGDPDTERQREAMRTAPTRELPSVVPDEPPPRTPSRPASPGVLGGGMVPATSSGRRTMPFTGAPSPEGELEAPIMSAAARVASTAPPPITTASVAPPGSSPSSAPASPVSDPTGPATPAETPSARSVEEPASRPRSSRPEVLYTAPKISTPPSRKPQTQPPTDETVRFSREQLQLLETERDEGTPLDVHVSEAKLAAAEEAQEREETTEPSIDVNALMNRENAGSAPRPPAKRDEPRDAHPGAPAVTAPLPAPRAATGRTMLLGFAGGVGVAIVIGGAFALFRTKPVEAPRATSEATSSGSTAALTTETSAPPRETSSSPKAATSAPHAPAPAASSAPSPSARAASSPPGDIAACVRGAYGDGTFAADADLGFVCEERSVRKTAQRLHRAIVAGGRGRAVTDAMREWSQLRWFEVPAVVSLRTRCCPAAPADLPTVSAACSTAHDTIRALATAAASGADLDEPIRDYRRVVSCFVSTGDASSFGQDGPMTGGEDTTFRAFAARVQK